MVNGFYKLLAVVGGQNPSSGGGNINFPNPLGVTTFQALIDRILGYLVLLATPIVALMIFVGAFQILTAAGNPEKVTQGRKTITYTVLGYVIILIARGASFIIKDLLGAR